ncbi:MAG TPA: hypothetical protein VGC06_10460 [Actinomycetes bacterium]
MVIPLAARRSAGRALLVGSAAIAIAVAAPAADTIGVTSASQDRFMLLVVTPIVSAFIARNQPT